MKSVKQFLSNLAIVALVLVLSNCDKTEIPANILQIAADKLVGSWKITDVKYAESGTLTTRPSTDPVTVALKALTIVVTKNAENTGGGISVTGTSLPVLSVTTWNFQNSDATEVRWGTAKIAIPASFGVDDTNISTLVVKFNIPTNEKVPSLNPSTARTFGVEGDWELTITKQ